MYRIGWFATGRGRTSRELLATVQNCILQGEIRAQICLVFSNREPGESEQSDLLFETVNGFGIPLICLSYRKYREKAGVTGGGRGEIFPQWRLEYDREVMRLLQGFHPDLCVLAGYMLVVGPEMSRKYNMINLHPSAPGGPQGTWQEVIWRLIADNASQSGVMMHLVTPELDKGPAVTYCTYPIVGGDFDQHWREIADYSLEKIKRRWGENSPLFQMIRKHGVAREFPLIISTIKAFTEGRIRIDDGQIMDASGRPAPAYDLTSYIEEMLRKI